MCFLKNILKIFDIFVKMRYHITRDAEVSELADEQDSGSCERYAREGSSPFFRMIKALADARAFFSYRAAANMLSKMKVSGKFIQIFF